MLTVGSYQEMDQNKYEENWLIVRKPDDLPDFVKHIPALSPSPDLFQKYREACQEKTFNQKFFNEVYVPQFVKELSENAETLNLLENLTDMSKTKNIMLGCYCETEAMCHRSIIAGILLGMGAEINTRQEYLNYYKLYQMMKKRVKVDNWL